MKFLILNGPNLNMLGVREPGIYGTVDYEGMVNFVKEGCAAIGVETEFYQSNHEGSLWMPSRAPWASTMASSSTPAPTPTPAWRCWTQ